MINREIFTESPEDDLWRELLQYSYRANVSRYLKEHSLDEDEDTINTIIGSFLQANEYFKASKSANLQISPLLLYYGATNLLLGLTSLMTGKRPEIKNHGMTAIDSTISTYIAEANVVFGDPNTGGIHQFARILGFEKDLTKCGEWKMMDFLSSIVEIDQDYRKCYAQENGNTLLLDLFNTPTGTIERLYLNKNKVEAIVSAYLDLAEDRAERHIPMTMEDWSKRLDLFLMADDREVLQDAGKITAEIAKAKAETEFEKYRVIQDRLFMSDFDKYMLELEENAKK